MKEGIHPPYEECLVRCSCGNEFKTRSTKKEIHIAICGQCHPFYTGKQKFVDTAGRIEKFQRRYHIEEGKSTAEAVKVRPAQKGQSRALSVTTVTKKGQIIGAEKFPLGEKAEKAEKKPKAAKAGKKETAEKTASESVSSPEPTT